MPGYILHLTTAHMFMDMLSESNPLHTQPDLQNDFYIGNLLPDSVRDKHASHFRDTKYLDRMVIWPRPEEFCRKYQEHMEDVVYFGYYFHLYIDRRFFSDYLPRVVEFLDDRGEPTELRQDVHSVLLKKSGKHVTLDQYLSEEYYYGDYTKMNTWLCERYDLPDQLHVCRDPGIEEADFSHMDQILDELKSYRKVSVEAVHDIKVFDVADLLDFLEQAVQEAEQYYGVFISGKTG